MIRVHYSNRLENLIAPLAEALSKQQRIAPLVRIPIIVPSRTIENFIKHRVSEAIGVAANLEFPFLRSFLGRIVESADSKLRVLDVEELELILFESLRAALRIGSPDFEPPRRYVESAGSNDLEQELRTFHLARQTARLFREYSITRASMLRNWLTNTHIDLEQLSSTERWQRSLWISTFEANGYLREAWKNRSDYHWMLLPDAFERLSADSLRSALPPVLHIFGLAYTGPAYAGIFAQLGELTELNVYAINPCLEFWEDVEQLSGVARESWARRHQKVAAVLEESDDPFALNVAGDTPALRLWGRPGREYIRLLNELTECDFDAHFTHHNSSSILATLQESILNREPEPATRPARDYLVDDGSIRFLACAGIARETEIVANEIWSLLDRDQPERDALRFHQIAVIVPDSLYESYLPHIESAFSRDHDLPVNVVGRGVTNANPILEAVSMLLRLPLGRFSRDEMLHLLKHPAISGSDPETGREQWSKWSEALGIVFGADAADLADTYLPRDILHWDQGLRRLALGVFMGTDRDEDARFFTAPDGVEYLPYETSQDELDGVASFVKTARSLLSDAVEIRSHKLPLQEWSRLLSALILTHIHTSDPADERIRERCVLAIDSIANPDLRSGPVSYQVAYEIASARVLEVGARAGQFTEHGIVVGPLSALRAIPFRTVFILGLNENLFPERHHNDPMDLRVSKRRAGDVTPTERDRYLFLETLLAARERLYLSYLARDSQTGDRREPSSIVRELQYILRGYLGAETLPQLTIEHPLSRYDPDYFRILRGHDSKAARELVSFDSQALRGARMAELRADLAHHCEGSPLPGRDESILEYMAPVVADKLRPALSIVEIPKSPASRIGLAAEISLPISALRKFLECPLQGAARYALGIFEDDEDGADDSQDEPLAQSILDRTVLLRDAFWKTRGDRNLLENEYSRAFRISQIHGHAPAGPFADAAQLVDLERLESWIAQVEAAGYRNLARWQEIRLGRGNEFSNADRIISELSLTVHSPIREGAAETTIVKIHGSLGFMSPALDTSIRPVLRDQAKAKDFLGPFLSALALVASGEITRPKFHAIVVGAGRKKSPWNEPRTLLCPTPEQARIYLSTLAADLLFGRNHYFLPIEAVEEVNKKTPHGQRVDLFDVVDDLRREDDQFSKCSSDYGPIRDARRFDPPSHDELPRIVERRFDLIRAIFGEKGN